MAGRRLARLQGRRSGVGRGEACCMCGWKVCSAGMQHLHHAFLAFMQQSPIGFLQCGVPTGQIDPACTTKMQVGIECGAAPCELSCFIKPCAAVVPPVCYGCQSNCPSCATGFACLVVQGLLLLLAHATMPRARPRAAAWLLPPHCIVLPFCNFHGC